MLYASFIYFVLQIEFVLGREIEKGGLYKGIVTSIKEYGAFVEFNGGQQGILHISELSHNPVCKRNEKESGKRENDCKVSLLSLRFSLFCCMIYVLKLSL